jgi:hypothetical protein
MKFLDTSTGVKSWNSECIVVPYRSPVDRGMHRYFIDFRVDWADGSTFLVEVKPECQTKQPAQPSRKSNKFLMECMTFCVNQAKWEAASEYALDHGWKFVVWTEKTLKSMGIRIL